MAPGDPIERDTSDAAPGDGFHRVYQALGLEGAGSYRGRRTFSIRAARKIAEPGVSLRDVRQLAGHTGLATIQRYIGRDSDPKRKVVSLI